MTRLQAERRGVDSREGYRRKFLSSPPRPDRLWGSLSLVSNGYRGGGKSFPVGKAAGTLKLTVTSI